MAINVFALTFIIMLALILLELAMLRYARGEPIPWAEVIFNLNSGHIVMWALRGVEVACFAWLLRHFNLHWVDQLPVYAQWLFAFVAWDLSFYCMHRAHHTIPFFWKVHKVHHQGEHFGLSLGVRNSWYSSLTSLIFVSPLAMMGLPLEMFVVASSFHYGVQFYNHTALVNKSGFLDKIMVTPANHRVHHAIQAIYLNKNFGGTLLIWDILFGSYQAQRDDVPMSYGVTSHDPISFNPLWASNPALQQRFKKLTQKSLFNPAQSLLNIEEKDLRNYIATSGILLFTLVIYYVAHDLLWMLENDWQVKWMLFTYLVLGTLSIGAFSDRQRMGLIAWCGLVLSMPLVFVGIFSLRDGFAIVLFALLFIHGLMGIAFLKTHNKVRI